MKSLVFILGILTGILVLKGTFEYSNVRQIKIYNSCIAKAISDPNYLKNDGPSGYQQCKHLLSPTKMEEIILWQPNIWCKYDELGCAE